MQASVSLGSSSNVVLSSQGAHNAIGAKAGASTSHSRDVGSARWQKFQKPFFTGDLPTLASRLNTSSTIPLRPPYNHRSQAFTRFFINGRKWGQKDPHTPEPQNGAETSSVKHSWVQKQSTNLLQKSAWVAAVLLMGGGALYGQAKAQAYIETTFLPPVAAMVGEYFGREIELGKVQSLSPLGLTLGPCSVGTHEDEFSCGEIPGVEIRVLPLASLRRGQLVVDAVLAQPHLLVSQKEDWTWLGIPLTADEKKKMRHSSEVNLDSRTQVRRLSREQQGQKFTIIRNQAAREAALSGYRLARVGAESDSKRVSSTKSSMLVAYKVQSTVDKQSKDQPIDVEDSENEDGIDTSSNYLGEVDGIKAGQHVEERLNESEELNSLNEWKNSIIGAKVWLDTNMLKPVKRRVLRRWTNQGIKPMTKVALQNKNLERSGAAARAYFERLDRSQSPEMKGGGSGALENSSDVNLVKDNDANDQMKMAWSAANEILLPPEQSSKAIKLPPIVSPDTPIVDGYRGIFSSGNRPSLSLSSALGARQQRKLEGKARASLDKPLLHVEHSLWKQKSQAEHVSFRRYGGRQHWRKSLGRRLAGLDRQVGVDLESSEKKQDDVTSCKNAVVDNRSDTEEGCSMTTEEIVKELLVQAVRDRQEAIRDQISKASISGMESADFNTDQLGGNVQLFGSSNEGVSGDLNSLVTSEDQEELSNVQSPSDIIFDEKDVLDPISSHHTIQTDPRSNSEGDVGDLPSGITEKHIHFASFKEPYREAASSPGPFTAENEPNSSTLQSDFLFEKEVCREPHQVDRSLNREDAHIRQAETDDDIGGSEKPNSRATNVDSPRRPLVALNSVYFKEGSLMLLAYGDREPRIMEKAAGVVKFGNSYDQINVRVTGNPKEWRTENIKGDGGKIFVKVAVDLAKQEWHLKVRARNLYAPLFEKLLEVPLDWTGGRANGEVHAWMLKDDQFPNFGGRVDIKGLDFSIWDAPAPFKGVNGTLFFQGQRLFFHNTSGLYGAIPLQVSGDMDLNPDEGEYRLSCQVAGVEANALMRTLKAQPPPYPLAGALKAVVHCRGPLDAPIFEGTAEVSGKHLPLVYESPASTAVTAIKDNHAVGAVAAYDRIPFTSASASFTFNTDNCMAELYGVKAVPVGGGEIRGGGNLWICPEGELDPSAVSIDCSGQVATDPLLRFYIPSGVEIPPNTFGTMHNEAKIRGSILMPVFDIKWNTPEAQGSFSGAHGDVHISREAIVLNSSAFTYDLSSKLHTLHPPIEPNRTRIFEYKPAPPPTIEGLDLDLRLRGFDVMGMSPVRSPLTPSSHMKVTGKVKFNGHVPKSEYDEAVGSSSGVEANYRPGISGNGIPGLKGEISLSGVKLNQLLVAPQLNGSLEISPTSFKVHTSGRPDEHLHVVVSKHPVGTAPAQDSFFEPFGEGASFSLLRGQLRTDLHFQPGHSAKVEIRNLQLDELELASLRGAVQKAELALNFQKRRGQGNLSVRRPRCSGVQGESLDINARWSGDVITLDKLLLEQANSRYEMQGEYVLPGLRDRTVIEKGKEERMWEKAMAGHLGNMITSMGRWRLRLDVPKAEVSDMLPVARLLSRSSDPAVVSRSKELFLESVSAVGFTAETLKDHLEYLRQSKGTTTSEGTPESIPLPGLAELRGAWHGTLEASGGGDGDTYADFDLRGEEWEWGAYKTKRVIAIGDYCNTDGLRLEKFFIQKDTATLHADGTLLGPKPNLHFAVLNFPVDLVPPLMHAIQSSTPEPFLTPSTRPYNTPIKGVLYMEGDLRGHLAKPQCDVQIRLLDGAVGGISLGKAEMAASITSANRLAFNAVLEPIAQTGHVRVRGSLPMGPGGLEEHEVEVEEKDKEMRSRTRGWGRERNRDRKDDEEDEKSESVEKGGEEGWEVRLAESLKSLDGEILESGAVQVDAAVKDGGMMLLTAISPGLHWLQGSADIKLQVRGTVQQPVADGVASFYKVAISSPVLPRPLSNLGGTIRVKNNQLFVEGLEGRVGRRGLVEVKGQLPLKDGDFLTSGDAIELKTEHLEVRARNAFSGQVNSQVRLMGTLLEPEVTGMIKLSHGEAYLSQEKGNTAPPSTISSSPPGGGYSWMAAASSVARHGSDIFPLPELVSQVADKREDTKDGRSLGPLPPVDIRLRGLKLVLGPELRMVYPLILNFAVSGELELNGYADPLRVKPRGTLTFENGDVNLVATQVRLNKDHPNRAKFEPEQGLDPSLDLALMGADWQLKVQGRARNWQDNIVVSSTRSGEQDALTRMEAARVFESQLAESLLEGDGQLAFKKLAAATVETLMPRIETKGEFGQARWRLVSAPQIPNLLSLDPTTDPFKSLANLSFGAEVEVQLGKHLQASVVRQLKESEMATQWTLLYQLNSKLRLLFSSIPSVDNRLLFEYSATSQN
ncbi:hypothetical protein MPTK1_3g15020 [Marchantia polymorpha subsp. ruderalis]|uniref:Translocation and assembly module TamB C-terminal domain-containing protein n=2 Tax=Marchantia polymorpha TaxID=3197 RepID=A0AAF6B0Y5_MARPO|nr:hypothetical protein MARPO_0004s0170 [Marchantia polymorpha]BBN05669.1 hypothetical protein Mp_3g15020 [Marchantia polymorpha subsp. ruderalis]|eukprot:PTQ48913.1 hypothetical protein MARPO_0004s0170 [Marchantia polymorpha]